MENPISKPKAVHVCAYTRTRFGRLEHVCLSTPERSCIGSPERKYISDSGKKAPELGAFS